MFHHISSMIFIYDIHLWIYDIHLHMVHIPKKKKKKNMLRICHHARRPESINGVSESTVPPPATSWERHWCHKKATAKKINPRNIIYHTKIGIHPFFFPFLMLFRGCTKVKYHQISGMMWRELLSKVAISHCVRMMKIWSTRLLQSISEGVIRVLYHLLGIPSFAPSRAAILILVSWLHCE